jgi:hypothetical protein
VLELCAEREIVRYVVSGFRRTVGACLFVLALVAPHAASAQGGSPDPRWHAWVGCWTAATSPTDAAYRPVCVVPAPGTSAVDVVTITDGRVASREHIEANGERRPSDRDGCTGWETARWSGDARHVYLQSEHQCAAGAKRSSSGLITMSPQGEWLDIVSVTLGQNTGVRVLRHRPIGDPSGLPDDVRAALQTVPASRLRDARTAAVAPLGLADIIDASHQLHNSVVSAWLNDLRQSIAVDAKRLTELADAGVPAPVIDMMVALAYPNAFAVPPSPTTVGALVEENARGGGGGAVRGFDDFASIDPFNCGFAFSLYGWGGCSPFAYSPFGFSPFGYRPYGYLPYSYSRFGYGPYDFGGAYGGWYASAPTVVVIRPGDQATHGQVVNGRGYSSGGSGTSATPTSSDSGSTGSSGGTVGSASSGGGDRTAHPR